MVKIGIVGCGGITNYHATYLEKIPEASVVALCDLNPKAIEKMRQTVGPATAYDSVERLLDHDGLDAVMVGTPTHLHAEPAIAALAAGKHTFVEKPITRTMDQCDALLAAAEKSSGTLTVGFVRRYDEDWGAMGRIVTENRVGRPVIWRTMAGHGRPGLAWFNDIDQGGGPLMDGAVHNYDFMLQRMFGPAKRVLAVGVQWDTETNRCLDTGSAIVEFESGDQWVSVWSWGGRPGGTSASHNDVIGPMGGVTKGLTDEQRPNGFDPKTQDGYFVGAADNPHAEVFAKKDMFAEQMAYWVETCQGKNQPIATGQHGKQALQLALAVLEAMRRHGEVDVASIT
ncbi:MAG: Gfo/Idh/MocA family oxidoreductase [Phycisphaerae bacterium]|nr:Gfo/Idh/MocA family oxidoreductase [Phycisphaerae bacterium]